MSRLWTNQTYQRAIRVIGRSGIKFTYSIIVLSSLSSLIVLFEYDGRWSGSAKRFGPRSGNRSFDCRPDFLRTIPTTPASEHRSNHRPSHRYVACLESVQEELVCPRGEGESVFVSIGVDLRTVVRRFQCRCFYHAIVLQHRQSFIPVMELWPSPSAVPPGCVPSFATE